MDDVKYSYNISLCDLNPKIETLKQNIQDSTLIIFEGCSHNTHLENPEKFNKTIYDFLI